MPTDYSAIKLSADQIAAEAYKQYLGGGAKNWEKRGAFQVELLRSLGLRPHHTLLDIGCGPLRGGVHFIRFLQTGNYWGVDFNASFIEAGHELLKQAGLSSAVPQVSLLTGFDFRTLNRTFDYMLCFSVLNHCSGADRTRFFENVGNVMHAGSRLIVSHGSWFHAAQSASGRVGLLRTIATEAAMGAGLRLRDWGYDDGRDNRLPILEFGLA